MRERPDIEACYRRYGPLVYRRCQRLLRDDDKAADAMHDVFVLFLRSGGVAALSPASLLNRIATNVCLNRLRADGYRESERDEEVLHAIASEGDLEERTLAGRLLSQLFARQAASTRVMAVLHFVDGMTLEEVAEEVGLSVSGVRKRLRGLKGRLKGMARPLEVNDAEG